MHQSRRKKRAEHSAPGIATAATPLTASVSPTSSMSSAPPSSGGDPAPNTGTSPHDTAEMVHNTNGNGAHDLNADMTASGRRSNRQQAVNPSDLNVVTPPTPAKPRRNSSSRRKHAVRVIDDAEAPYYTEGTPIQPHAFEDVSDDLGHSPVNARDPERETDETETSEAVAALGEIAEPPTPEFDHSLVNGDSSVQAYLREIQDVPLLKPEEETSLGRLVRASMGFNLCRKYMEHGELPETLRQVMGKVLVASNVHEPTAQSLTTALAAWLDNNPQHPNHEALSRLQSHVPYMVGCHVMTHAEGKDVYDRMVRANLRLVVNIAKSYVNRGLSLMDLIAEGNIGLMKAVERFNPTEGTRFSTYATWWIKQAIRRALDSVGRPIRLPAYITGLIAKFRAKQRELSTLLNRQPTVPEIAEALHMKSELAERISRSMRGNQSLDQELAVEGLGPLGDTLEDERGRAPVEELGNQADLERLNQLIGQLEPREAEILRLRFGLHDVPAMTLKEIGRRMKLTRERVRQIESEALRKLHKLLVREQPRAYLDE